MASENPSSGAPPANESETEVSFLDALKSRYGAEDDISSYDPSAFLVGDKGRRKNKTWELVGMEKTRAKQSRYDRLPAVSLRNANITVAVKASERREGGPARDGEAVTFPDDLAAQRMVSLQELDLSGNVRLPLGEVAQLISYFARLSTLQLCDMPGLLPSFSPAVAESHSPLLASGTIRKLVLNSVGFTSLVQLRVVMDLPHLEELHLDANGVDTLVLAGSAEEEAFLAAPDRGESWLRMPSVHTLSLARNAIQSWDSLAETLPKAFPALERLFLTGNKLPNLPLLPPADTDADTPPGRETPSAAAGPLAATYAFLRPLKLLCVNENLSITDTRTVDAVRVLCPQLEVFRITYSALLPRWNDTLSRMFVVASLPTIQVLNRGQVRAKERRDSEIFYIQRGLAQREALNAARKDGEDAVAAAAAQLRGEPDYPLLDVLQEKHKDLVLSIYKAGATASSDGSSHIMLDVRLRCDNNYKHLEGRAEVEKAAPSMFQEVRKTLPSSLTIAKLKALLKVTFQVDLPNQEVSYRSGDDGVLDRPVMMDNEMQTLGFYGVGSGAVITVRDTSLR